MKTLIDNYESTVDFSPLLTDSNTVKTIHYESQTNSSIRLNQAHEEQSITNSKIFSLLDEIATLKDNWDNDGAKAPNLDTIQAIRGIIKLLSRMGQSIFHTAPGPSGEIMLDFRNKNKSLELIFYPNKRVYVTFSETENPKQGNFNNEILPELLSWLNKD
jgi:hypothetical protein